MARIYFFILYGSMLVFYTGHLAQQETALSITTYLPSKHKKEFGLAMVFAKALFNQSYELDIDLKLVFALVSLLLLNPCWRQQKRRL